MGSISDGKNGYAAFTWVDCSTWNYVLAESEGPWLPIAADTLVDEASNFVCKNITQYLTTATNRHSRAASAIPTPKRLRGKCTFLSSTGGKSLVDDPCRIDQQGSTTTLYWSDNVFTRIVLIGSQVEIFNPGGQPFIGCTVVESSIHKIIEYEKVLSDGACLAEFHGYNPQDVMFMALGQFVAGLPDFHATGLALSCC